ncbi:hypothetical protein BASA81_018273 [Batrachochytrium salamandrivorans]|nr:hypothetical protein BASA81_018273 [Batrachochytrium salamandrivorans]
MIGFDRASCGNDYRRSRYTRQFELRSTLLALSPDLKRHYHDSRSICGLHLAFLRRTFLRRDLPSLSHLEVAELQHARSYAYQWKLFA